MGAAGTGVVIQTSLQAAIGQGVAGGTTRAVGCSEARDTAVASGLATRQAENGAICVGCALNAFFPRAMCPRAALADGTAARGTVACDGSASSRTARSTGSAARPPTERGPGAGHDRASRASSLRLGIELETLIARRTQRAEGKQGEHACERAPGAQRGQSSHGSAASFCASRTAKPRG